MNVHVIGGRLDGMTVPYTGPLMVVENDTYQFRQGGGDTFYILVSLLGRLGREIR